MQSILNKTLSERCLGNEVKPISSQQGVTLIEAMIALFVFSVGALGLAAMQLSSLTNSGDSQQRSLAIWKAQELADRIRSNPALADDYVIAVNNSTIDNIGVDTAAGRVTAGAGICLTPAVRCSDYINASGVAVDGVVCTDDETVTFDVWEVICDANSGVVSAGGAVESGSSGLAELELVLRQNTLAVDGNDDMEIYFEWVSRRSGEISEVSRATVETDLCGREDVDVDGDLDVYCLRFRP